MKSKPVTFPPLPPRLHGLSGEITILRPVQLSKKLGAVGVWEYEHRRIRVQGSLPRRLAWEVLLHELAHAAITDSGIQVENEKDEERWADAMASAFMHVVTHLVTERE